MIAGEISALPPDVARCASRLLPVDIPTAASSGAQLVKLRVEGLPLGADTGVSVSLSFTMRSPRMNDRSAVIAA
jgi:hypothetical protein